MSYVYQQLTKKECEKIAEKLDMRVKNIIIHYDNNFDSSTLELFLENDNFEVIKLEFFNHVLFVDKVSAPYQKAINDVLTEIENNANSGFVF